MNLAEFVDRARRRPLSAEECRLLMAEELSLLDAAFASPPLEAQRKLYSEVISNELERRSSRQSTEEEPAVEKLKRYKDAGAEEAGEILNGNPEAPEPQGVIEAKPDLFERPDPDWNEPDEGEVLGSGRIVRVVAGALAALFLLVAILAGPCARAASGAVPATIGDVAFAQGKRSTMQIVTAGTAGQFQCGTFTDGNGDTFPRWCLRSVFDPTQADPERRYGRPNNVVKGSLGGESVSAVPIACYAKKNGLGDNYVVTLQDLNDARYVAPPTGVTTIYSEMLALNCDELPPPPPAGCSFPSVCMVPPPACPTCPPPAPPCEVCPPPAPPSPDVSPGLVARLRQTADWKKGSRLGVTRLAVLAEVRAWVEAYLVYKGFVPHEPSTGKVATEWRGKSAAEPDLELAAELDAIDAEAEFQ